jgi:hypothetical protein
MLAGWCLLLRVRVGSGGMQYRLVKVAAKLLILLGSIVAMCEVIAFYLTLLSGLCDVNRVYLTLLGLFCASLS